MRQLDSETLSAQDITSALTVLTTTPSATVATRCGLHVELSGLDGSGGTFLCYITLGGVPLQPYPMAVAFGENATAIIQREFLCPANAEVIAQILSPNAADTSVGVVATLWDTTPLQPATVGRQVAIDANGKTDPTGLPANFADMVIEPATAWTDIVLSSGGSMMVITSTIGGFTADMVGRYLYLECAEGFGVSLIAGFTSANVLEGYYPDAFFNLIEDPEEGGPISNVTGILGGRALLSENTHRPQDQSATSAHTLLSQRLLGTIAAGTHTAQSGNNYPIVSSASYGNSALKTLIDTVDTVADAIKAKTDNLKASWNDLDAAGVRAALGMSSANLDTQLGGILGYVDCLPESWVVPPAGSDWTATRAGYQDKLNVSGTLAHSDAAATYKADVSGVPAAVKEAMEAEGGHLALILEDTAAIPTANDVADALLGRDASEVEDTAPEHSLCTVILAMLESSVSGTTWTIKRTNGETTHATKAITTDADAKPITGVS